MMNKKAIFAVILALVVVSVFYVLTGGGDDKPVAYGAVTEVPTGAEWIDLLDEEHRSNWENITDDMDLFEFQEDMLHIFGVTITPLRYVGYSAERFGNFQLHLEYKIEPGGNSGLFLRMQPGDEMYRGFEVQVQDDFGQMLTANTSGGVYDVVTPMHNMSMPAGEWNSYDITVNNRQVEIIMNGWKVVDSDFSKMTMPIGKFDNPYATYPLDGVIALQDHGGEAWYRNVRLKKLPDTVATESHE